MGATSCEKSLYGLKKENTHIICLTLFLLVAHSAGVPIVLHSQSSFFCMHAFLLPCLRGMIAGEVA